LDLIHEQKLEAQKRDVPLGEKKKKRPELSDTRNVNGGRTNCKTTREKRATNNRQSIDPVDRH